MAEQNPFDEVFGGVSFTPSVSAGELRKVAVRRQTRQRWAIAGVVAAAALLLSAGGVVVAQQLAARDQQGDPSPWGTASPTQATSPPTVTASPKPTTTPEPRPSDSTPPRKSTSAPAGPATINPASGMMPPILPDPTELGWPMTGLESVDIDQLRLEDSWPGCDAVAQKLRGQPTVWWRPPGQQELSGGGPSTRARTIAVSTPNGAAIAKNLLADIRGCVVDGMTAPSDVVRSTVAGTAVDRWTREGATPEDTPTVEQWAVIHTSNAVVISTLSLVQDGKMTRAEADAGMARHVEAAARNLANPRFDVPVTPGTLSMGTGPRPDALLGGSERWSSWWVGRMSPQAVLGECDAIRLLYGEDNNLAFSSIYTDHSQGGGSLELYGSAPEAPEAIWRTIRDNAKDCKLRLSPESTIKAVSLKEYTFSGHPAWVGVYDVTTTNGDTTREVWGAVNLGDRIVVGLASRQVTDGPEQVRIMLETVASNDTP